MSPLPDAEGPHSSGPPSAGATPRRVLVVEDDGLVASMVEQALVHVGHHVESAASGAEALELVRCGRFQPDLVLTDLTLEDLSGIEVARGLRRLLPGIDVIVTSGYLSTPVQDAEWARRGYRFLAKPFGARALIEMVGRRIERA